ncbi:MAG: hypothetical protein NPIRA05_14760 [Nitrospirales bacterium]|nr:MAG: hypothetical protein NPIRA05_14760 [Nitrospirales bacterium]
MKTTLYLVTIFIFSIGWNVALAESVTPVCEAVKEKAWKAEQVLAERQRVLQIAQRKARLAYAQLVECRPGAIFSASRAQRCAHAQSDVPIQVQAQLDAEYQLEVASVDYQKKNQWVARECALKATMLDQTELLLKISALKAEVQALKTFIEQLDNERPLPFPIPPFE